MKRKILLIAQKTSKATELENSLVENGYQPVTCSMDEIRVKQALLMINPDIVVCYESEPSSELIAIIEFIQLSSPTPIIVFTDNSKEDFISKAIVTGASSFIVDGMESHRIKSIIDVGVARFNKCQTMKVKLTKTEQKLHERRDIDRAKGILMKRKNISEDEAYKLLRTIAMEKNQRIGEVANTVIQAAELLN